VRVRFPLPAPSSAGW